MIDKFFDDDPKNSGEQIYESLLNFCCLGKNCNSDEEMIISGFILLLNMVNDETIDNDKLVEYAILWLSYKLNQKKQNRTTKLYNFYTENIETNNCYKENIAADSDSDSNSKINKNVICKKIKSMDIDIKDISNFYDAFKSLCNIYISPLVACPRSSITKNIIIPIAIIFVAASILLGVSYKYSLFGFRKRSQKQHLREMLKK
ncbi:hypothetical protein YYC_00260 [Plasmodium yoelii 17X]|uniref:YIR protein n=1 Tax=Plasmodium yoelii 17X TaxID=1323249 RepID=V7PX53_PLAYE|nr:hypothetical protein YYC_00260 [Plasmodium yoelii 17X]